MGSSVAPQLAVIVPVGERHSDAETLHAQYRKGVAACASEVEFIYVLDGDRADFRQGLERLIAAGEALTIVSLTRPFGEATAIRAGFEQSTAQRLLILPAYPQVAPEGFQRLIEALDTANLAVSRRWPRVGGPFERLRRAVFHGLLSRVTKLHFSDLGCTVRALDRSVLDEIDLYGDQHRFLPVLADRQGFKVREIDVPQAPNDRNAQIYGPRSYAQGFLDIFTVFFLVRFTKKPLRFFGMIGVVTFGIGLLAMLVLVFQRFFLDTPLADRPAFLVATLFVVLGLQVFALGLLGELIIFVHAGSTKDYKVDRVIQFAADGTEVVTIPAESER